MANKQRRNPRASVDDRWRPLKKPRAILDENKQPVLDRNGEPLTTTRPVNYGKGKRWRARWVDEHGIDNALSFRTKEEAKAHLDQTIASQVTGTYIDPRLSKITLNSFYRDWSMRKVWVQGTVQAMNLAVSGATFGDVPFSELKPSHIEAWVRAMRDKPLAPSTIRTRFNNVHSVLKAAIAEKLLATDPAQNITLPRRRRPEAAMQIPTPEQVGSLIGAANPDFRAFVLLAAFAGLRLGEAAAMRVGDIDSSQKLIHVRRQVQRANGHKVEIREPKYGSERTVPAPGGVIDALTEHIANWLDADDDEQWLFPGQDGHPLHQNSVGYRWRKTKSAAYQPGWHLHDLRHFYASGLIYAGCDVVTVQKALGHSSANVTLSTYAHLWPNSDNRTRTAADKLLREATADPLRTEGA